MSRKMREPHFMYGERYVCSAAVDCEGMTAAGNHWRFAGRDPMRHAEIRLIWSEAETSVAGEGFWGTRIFGGRKFEGLVRRSLDL